MPPFNKKEVIRYFAWIAIAACVLIAIVWFVFYSSGRRTVPLTRGGSAAGFVLGLR